MISIVRQLKRHPGFWFNALTILCSVAYLVHLINNDVERIAQAESELSSSLLTIFQDKQSGKLDATAALGEARMRIVSKLMTFEDNYSADTAFFGGLHVAGLLASQDRVSFSSALPTVILPISEKIGGHLIYRQNRRPLFLWIFVALVYVISVAVSYFYGKIKTERGEPVLNIVDIGLYYSLVEHSGGLESVFVFAISISVAMALISLSRSLSSLTSQYGSLSSARMMGREEVYAELAPTGFYTFALLTGLIWSTVDTLVYQSNELGVYLSEYLQCLLVKIVLVGVILYVALSLIDQWSNRGKQDSRMVYHHFPA